MESFRFELSAGGLFGLFDGRMDETLKQMGTERNQFHEWMELSDQAPNLNLWLWTAVTVPYVGQQWTFIEAYATK